MQPITMFGKKSGHVFFYKIRLTFLKNEHPSL
jgi:hypothetical protein